MELTVFQTSPIILEMNQNPIYETCTKSLSPSSCHWTEFLNSACGHPFVCESSLHSSGSVITNSELSPTHVECLSQHIQTLTPTPGNCFINLLPLPCLGFDTCKGGTPHVQIPSLFHQPLDCPHRAAQFYAWMPTSPSLAFDFLHKSASMHFHLCGLTLLLCMPDQPPI